MFIATGFCPLPMYILIGIVTVIQKVYRFMVRKLERTERDTFNKTVRSIQEQASKYNHE